MQHLYNKHEVPVHIELSVRDGVPIYRQIVNQVRYLIASGQLDVGDELPPIRSLAQQLQVTPNTIVKAYDTLHAEGLLVKRHGSGTFVSEQASPLRKSEQRRILTQRADALLAEARQLNFSFAEVLELLEKRQTALDRIHSMEKRHD
ncbi:MAG: GntR family transcriptional regulator [Pirellulaceae bacterium]